MNKFNLSVFSLLLSLSAMGFAQVPSQNSCIQSAQIIATVSETFKEMSSCMVMVNSIVQFNSSYLCPLDISEIDMGIEVGMKSGHDCSYEIGDSISGILKKNSAGVILLE